MLDLSWSDECATCAPSAHGDTSTPFVHLCVDCMHPLHALKIMPMKPSLHFWCQTEVILLVCPGLHPEAIPSLKCLGSHKEIMCWPSNNASMHAASLAEMLSTTSTNFSFMEPQIICTNGPVCCVVSGTGQGSSPSRHPSSSKYLYFKEAFHPVTGNFRSLGLATFLHWLSSH